MALPLLTTFQCRKEGDRWVSEDPPFELTTRGSSLGGGSNGAVYRARFQDRDVTGKTHLAFLPNCEFFQPEDRINPMMQGQIDFICRSVLTEARHLQRLEHPRILRFLGIMECRDEGFRRELPMWILTEFAEHGCLTEWIHTGAGLGLDWVARFGHDLFDGLGHMHRHNTIHGDIKPANLLVSRSGRLVVADLGCAKEFHAEEFEGTPIYLGPEGMSNQPSRDIFAAACTLCEAILREDVEAGREERLDQKRRATSRANAGGIGLARVLWGGLDDDPRNRPPAGDCRYDVLRRGGPSRPFANGRPRAAAGGGFAAVPPPPPPQRSQLHECLSQEDLDRTNPLGLDGAWTLREDELTDVEQVGADAEFKTYLGTLRGEEVTIRESKLLADPRLGAGEDVLRLFRAGGPLRRLARGLRLHAWLCSDDAFCNSHLIGLHGVVLREIDGVKVPKYVVYSSAETSLPKRLQRRDAPDAETRARYAADMVGAVAFLHGRGITLADIGPQAFWIDRGNHAEREDRVVLHDLGGAAAAAAGARRDRYEPPERTNCSKGDVFCLGASVAEVLGVDLELRDRDPEAFTQRVAEAARALPEGNRLLDALDADPESRPDAAELVPAVPLGVHSVDALQERVRRLAATVVALEERLGQPQNAAAANVMDIMIRAADVNVLKNLIIHLSQKKERLHMRLARAAAAA